MVLSIYTQPQKSSLFPDKNDNKVPSNKHQHKKIYIYIDAHGHIVVFNDRDTV